jgi:hypothetical protein
MPRTARAIVTAAAVLALSATGSATGRSSVVEPRITTTRGAVESLALDGGRVAFDVASFDNGCNTLHVWEPRRGTDVVVSGPATCAADSTSTGGGVREIALAGRRVAWIVDLGGNTESTDTLYTAVVGGPRERRVASATTASSQEAGSGTWPVTVT